MLPHPWYTPTIAMYQNGLYVNSCSSVWYASVPYNSDGYQYAHTGQAYAVIQTYLHSAPNSERIYLQTKLKDSLTLGKYYYGEFYASAGDIVAYGSNNISILLTKKAIYVDTLVDPRGVIIGNAQVYNYGNPIIVDTQNWVKVSSIFKAQGGERFITIGNFKNGNQTNTKLINNTTAQCDCAGYFIDDVSVIPLDSFCLKADAGRDTTIKVGDSVFIGSLTNGLDSVKWYANGTTLIDSIRPGFWVTPTASGSYFYVLQQTVNGCFSKDTVYVNVTPLPLKMISYKLLVINDDPNSSLRGTKQSVENIWTTANEINVSHFNIQRSKDGKNFTTIGKINAKGFSYNEYSFTDNSPSFGDNYYRIESIDKDGKMNYTEIKKLTINNSSLNINIYPNPAKDIVNIECKEGMKEVKVFDYLGREISHFVRNDGNIHRLSLNIHHYAKGVYVVQITTAKGEVKSEKLIVE